MSTSAGALLWWLLALPAAGVAACWLARSARAVLAVAVAFAVASAATAALAVASVFRGAPMFAGRGWLFLDPLSALHLAALHGVFLLCTLLAWEYFGDEIVAGRFGVARARQFGSLWLGSLGTMTLALLANNLGLMWVGIEATTLVTALLIPLHRSRASLEAMWKYLLLCSVGVAFAFMGTLWVAASAAPLHLSGAETMLWTTLRASAARLDPGYVRVGFLFALVGFGTKAGLAPMHTWLPDAHSQAPAPVSALFSGFMLSTALYAVFRYLPLAEAATGNHGWALSSLRFLGGASLVFAAAFLLFQKDLKRLLAYSSVEHMGVVAMGVGLGPLGAFAALLHMLGHASGKVLAFAAAGRLGQAAGSNEIDAVAGVARSSPLWGRAMTGALLVLMGAFPSVLFVTELQIAAAAAAEGAYVALGVFLGSLAVAFVALVRPLLAIGWNGEARSSGVAGGRLGPWIVGIPLLAAVASGLWLPEPVRHAVELAARTLAGGGR